MAKRRELLEFEWNMMMGVRQMGYSISGIWGTFGIPRCSSKHVTDKRLLPCTDFYYLYLFMDFMYPQNDGLFLQDNAPGFIGFKLPRIGLGTFLRLPSNLPTPTFAWHVTNEACTERSGEVCSHAWSCTCSYRKAVVSYRIVMAYHLSRWFANTCGIDVTLSCYTSPT